MNTVCAVADVDEVDGDLVADCVLKMWMPSNWCAAVATLATADGVFDRHDDDDADAVVAAYDDMGPPSISILIANGRLVCAPPLHVC